MRLTNLADDLGVPINDLRSCYSLHFGSPCGPNKLLSPTEISQLTKFYLASKSGKIIYVNKKVIEFEDTLPQHFNNSNPYSHEIAFHINSKASLNFESRESSIYHFGDVTFDSKLSNFEAFSICRGLTDRHAQFISRRFFKDSHTPQDISEAQFLANKALKSYGINFLSHLITLPQLPVHLLDSSPLFSIMDKRSKSIGFHSMFRLVFTDHSGTTSKFKLSFLSLKKSEKTTINRNVLNIRNLDNNEDLMQISRSGTCVPFPSYRNIIPALQFFVSIASNPSSAILHYGLKTGECSICGRPLTDPFSIREGIGPICKKSII
ncbi:DUF6011 domain-containing protein [Jiulongibacter sediminis]|jgi:hypothetical protein|uniref:DUF6011 domain-containing protein n=1 Tax=Jiulongibacter sediminis TaxID=1605367 RepID=UPI0026ECEAC3|nr:DUF6011 domain-containing protein [Jiulongibacter sediminis]